MNAPRNEREAHASLLASHLGDDFPEPGMEPPREPPARRDAPLVVLMAIVTCAVVIGLAPWLASLIGGR